MTQTRHGQIPDWYNKDSALEASLNDDNDNARMTNRSIEQILAQHQVKTVLDMTCGSGSQVFWLTERGYQVTGSDISAGMLDIAKQKAKAKNLNLQLLEGDVRSLKVGHFDAVITIFNAIGHLSKAGFAKAMRNIHSNLNAGGLYIFDIINLNYVLEGDHITRMSLDRVKTEGNTRLRKIQYSLIDAQGILVSYTTYYTQQGADKPQISKTRGTLQLYTAKELQTMLLKNGFSVLGQYAMDGSAFAEHATERILTVAKKQ